MHGDQANRQTQTPKERWLASIDFKYSPFDRLSADDPEDTHLHEYFLAKDDPEEREDRAQVLSDLDDERSSLTFADSGCGKSAYRIFLGHKWDESGNLALHYTDFGRVIKAPSLDLHCEEILRLGAEKIGERLGVDYSFRRSKLRPRTRHYLDWLMQEYSDRFSYGEESSRTIPRSLVDQEGERQQDLSLEDERRLRQLKIEAARYGYDVPSEMTMEIGEISLRIAKHQAASNRPVVVKSPTPFEKLRHLREVCSELGANTIHVLVELVDPYPFDGWTETIQADLIESLVTHPKLLESLNLKLFLPTELRPVLETRYTASIGAGASLVSRWVVNELAWTNDQIKRLLVLRLKKASNNYHESFISLIEWRGPKLDDIDERIVSAARNNPRRLVRLCQMIFDQHWQAHPDHAQLFESETISAIDRFQ